MFDLNTEIKKFYKNDVSLLEPQQKIMRERRDANRKRLKKGLIKNEKPTPHEHVSQGSYSMHTMVQDDENEYDIDDGAVFLNQDLKNVNLTDMSSPNARKMVCEALKSKKLKTQPEVKRNCVRVHYDDGTHVDIPVYRKKDDETLELASSEWKGSSPTEVTEWYNQSVIDQSPDTKNGRQMRRITKLMKFFSKSRKSWKTRMPSGFAISILIDKQYIANANRDDQSLYDTMKAIKNRLDYNLVIQHPTQNENLTKTSDDADIKFLRDKLEKAIQNMDVLFQLDCSKLKALKAWNDVFKHEFFEDAIKTEKDHEKHQLAEDLKNGNDKISIGKKGVVAAAAGIGAIKTTSAFGGN